MVGWVIYMINKIKGFKSFLKTTLTSKEINDTIFGSNMSAHGLGTVIQVVAHTMFLPANSLWGFIFKVWIRILGKNLLLQRLIGSWGLQCCERLKDVIKSTFWLCDIIRPSNNHLLLSFVHDLTSLWLLGNHLQCKNWLLVPNHYSAKKVASHH